MSPRPRLLLLLLLLAIPSVARGALEPWSDPALPIQDGIRVWLDATRQPAAWEANGKALVGGEPLDVWYDGSGYRRHFTQPVRDAQPDFAEGNSRAAVRFDGKDDHFRWSNPGAAPLDGYTVFIVASARSNEGHFRAFVSSHETGKNDFDTGFNIDMGPFPSDGATGIAMFNAEGAGFVGVRNLLSAPIPFEEFHVFTLASATGKDAVAARVNGKPAGKRDRAPGSTASGANLVVGARCAAGGEFPPHLIGFLDGDIAEVLLFERVLSLEEHAAVEQYLIRKHEGASETLAANVAGAKPL